MLNVLNTNLSTGIPGIEGQGGVYKAHTSGLTLGWQFRSDNPSHIPVAFCTCMVNKTQCFSSSLCFITVIQNHGLMVRLSLLMIV